MNTVHPMMKFWIGLMMGWMLSAQSQAADSSRIPELAYFGPESFSALVAQRRPSIVVFSASYCANCPAVVRSLSKSRRRAALPPQLMVVMSDELPDQATRKQAYQDVDRLAVFQGNELAIRYAVNPAWRGLTPFVVLIGRDGEVSYFNGEPPARDLQAFMDRQAR